MKPGQTGVQCITNTSTGKLWRGQGSTIAGAEELRGTRGWSRSFLHVHFLINWGSFLGLFWCRKWSDLLLWKGRVSRVAGTRGDRIALFTLRKGECTHQVHTVHSTVLCSLFKLQSSLCLLSSARASYNQAAYKPLSSQARISVYPDFRLNLGDS